MIQPNDHKEGQGATITHQPSPSPSPSPTWGVFGPIPPILSILLAGATASAGSYIATRERLIIAEQRIESLQHQVADLKSDVASLRSFIENRIYSLPKAHTAGAMGKKVTVTLPPRRL